MLKEESLKEKILWVVPRLPWPHRCGASLANSALIRALTTRGWTIDLLCVGVSSTESELQEAKRNLGLAGIASIPHSFFLRNRFIRVLASFLAQLIERRVPITAMPFLFRRIASSVLESCSQIENRIVVWDGLHPMAALVRSGRPHSKSRQVHIYRAHNIESDLWAQFAAKAQQPLRFLIQRQASIMKDFEVRCVRFSDLCLLINSTDTHSMKRMIGPDCWFESLPVPLEDNQLKPKIQHLQMTPMLSTNNVAANDPADLRLIWMGGLDWWPNKEGILWFLEQVWPRVIAQRSAVHMDVVGLQTERLRRAEISKITFHGFVDDPQPLLKCADLMIVPIFSGSGIRVKAIEAMSIAIPCLGTRIGLSGLPAEGQWMSDEPSEWVEILLHLSREQCVQKGQLALAQLQGEFHAERVAGRFDELLGQLMRKLG